MRLNLLAGMISLTLFNYETYSQPSASNSETKIEKSNKMKEFSLLVRVPVNYSGEQAKAVNPKWDKVLNKWKADSVYITSFVFPGESYILSGIDRMVKKECVVSDHLKVVSNIILHAGNLEEAVELAKVCPVLELGGTVEVREVQPRQVQPAN